MIRTCAHPDEERSLAGPMDGSPTPDEVKRRKLNGWVLESIDDSVHYVNQLRAAIPLGHEPSAYNEEGHDRANKSHERSPAQISICNENSGAEGGAVRGDSETLAGPSSPEDQVQQHAVQRSALSGKQDTIRAEENVKVPGARVIENDSAQVENTRAEKSGDGVPLAKGREGGGERQGMDRTSEKGTDPRKDCQADQSIQPNNPFAVDPKTFRQYDLACERVKSFYQEQHQKQTVAYNLQARINFKTKTRAKMTIWEGLEKLNRLLDDSDPDTELSQIDHALQTAEAIRRDGQPRWMQLVGLIHDLGKLLYFFDLQGQWDVVGDTFPVGCRYSRRIIFSEAFEKNPDFANPLYSSKFGIYSKNCGLASVMLSWGHDEYMYHVAKSSLTLPDEALAMIRYHSFYPWHQENAYKYLMDEKDKRVLKWVRLFNKFDLYSKADERYNVQELKPYYLDLIDEFFPERVVEF